jgi:protease-4
VKIQKILIIGILLLPIIVGIIFTISEKQNSASSFSSSSIKKIGLIKVEGVIDNSYDHVKQLKAFRQDNSIAGVLLRIDSPGGAVAPSQEIYQEVMNYKLEQKPLIVSMGSVAASGGYYIASPAKKIFADAGTLTGSIGVIMQIPMFQEISKKIGIEMRTYKAGKYKDIISPYRSMSNQEQALVQNLLDDTHDQFIGDVAKGRGVPFDTIKSIADGRVFTGRQALSNHLVDTLGGFEDAIAYTKIISGLPLKAKIIEKKDKSVLFQQWLAEEIVHIFPQLQQYFTKPGLQYMLIF